MKCLKELTPIFTTSAISCQIVWFQPVMATCQPTSMQILPSALRCQSLTAFTSDPSGPGRTKSTIIVVPPDAAAAVPLSKVSAAVVPMKGISRWVWGSIPPGMT